MKIKLIDAYKKSVLDREKEEMMDSVLDQNQRNRPHPLYPSRVHLQVWNSQQAYNTGDTTDILMLDWHQPWLPVAGSTMVVVNVDAPIQEPTTRSVIVKVQTISTTVNYSQHGNWVSTHVVCSRLTRGES